MCQAFEGEQRALMSMERFQRRQTWEKHKSGEEILSEKQIRDLIAEEIMARDAGF